MELTDKHLDVIRTAALSIEYGSITIHAGTGDHVNITIENRLRLPIEQPEWEKNRPPLAARHTVRQKRAL